MSSEDPATTQATTQEEPPTTTEPAAPASGAGSDDEAGTSTPATSGGKGGSSGGGKGAQQKGKGKLVVPKVDRSTRKAALTAEPLTHYAFSKRNTVADVLAADDMWLGRSIVVAGWAKTVRLADGGKIIFIALNDGSCQATLQVVIPTGFPDFDAIAAMGTHTSFRVVGELVASIGGEQSVEIRATEVKILGQCGGADYPLAKGRHPYEFLRTIAHLRPRTNTFGAMIRVRSALAMATHDFFQKNGFTFVHTPIITASDCEGAGEMFKVSTFEFNSVPRVAPVPNQPPAPDAPVDFTKDFFKKPAMLTVSGQLSAECYACALGNVYNFCPAFRAENSHTTRHLSEFWMIEPEMAFVDVNDVIDCAEGFVRHCLAYVLEHCLEDLLFFDANVSEGLVDRLRGIVESPFERVTYDRAIELLTKKDKKGKVPKFEIDVTWGIDLGSEHERYIVEKIFKGKPVALMNYPKNIKAFYMRVNEDQRTVASFDLLIPQIGELIGGSQREERHDVLVARIEEMGLPVAAYDWYLDLRKFGTVPHGGFGLGFERLIMLATGLENIRDVSPFPRYPGHAEF